MNKQSPTSERPEAIADVQPLMTVEAAARLLGISRTTCYALMDQGHLPYHQYPGVRARRIHPADLATFVDGSRVGAQHSEC